MSLRMLHFRSDRIPTLYFFQPLRRLLGRTQAGIPVLMYHSISSAPDLFQRPYLRTHTSPEAFRRQMEFLHQAGYQTMRLSEAVEEIRKGAHRSTKAVVLTFDDGFADFYTEAFPVLREYGYSATVFLPTAFIGDETRYFTGDHGGGEAALTWSQVRELAATGIEFGSHTVTHRQLLNLTQSQVERELRESKAEIEQRTGVPVTTFAYPLAFPSHRREFQRTLKQVLASSGYTVGVCTLIGTANQQSDSHFMERLPVNSLDDEALLGAKLMGAYDWLRYPQTIFKHLKGLLQ